MRRWRRGEWGVMEGAGHLARKKNHFSMFCLQNDKFGCILPQFLTAENTEALGHGFYSSIAKLQSLQKQCQKYPKIHGQTWGGGDRTIAPEYATATAPIKVKYGRRSFP